MKVTDKESATILVDGLRSVPTVIQFTKKDGTSRTLLGTLNPLLIPVDHAPKGHSEEIDDEDLPYIRVFDLENVGWRTVPFAAVTDFNPA